MQDLQKAHPMVLNGGHALLCLLVTVISETGRSKILYPVACKCFLVFNTVFDVEWSKTIQ